METNVKRNKHVKRLMCLYTLDIATLLETHQHKK